MTTDMFLLIVQMVMGGLKLDGFLHKNLARKLRISRPLCSQYLRGDLEMPPEIRAKIIEILNLEHILRRIEERPPGREVASN
jgi:hypothetical protein